jgi:hypothetical protein
MCLTISMQILRRSRAIRRQSIIARVESAAMLELFRMTRQRHPELVGLELYRAIVALRLGCEAAQARAVVRRAEEEFAQWPVRREVTLRDVVRHIVIAHLIEPNETVLDRHAIGDAIGEFILDEE